MFRTSALTHWPTAFDISPNGHLLVFGCKGIVRIHEHLKFCLWTDGVKFLFSERVVKLMDYEEGSFQDYTGHYDGVAAVAFSPLGNILISACGSTLHVWTVTLQ